jgi:hypothetical protein
MHPRRSKANQTGTPGNKPVGITDLKPHFVFDMITSPLACGQKPLAKLNLLEVISDTD